MTSTRANVPGSNLEERLRAFMRTHHLSLEELAELLRTPSQTIVHWFEGVATPPGCVHTLLVLLETQPITRSSLGVWPSAAALATGLADDSAREEALRRARAI